MGQLPLLHQPAHIIDHWCLHITFKHLRYLQDPPSLPLLTLEILIMQLTLTVYRTFPHYRPPPATWHTHGLHTLRQHHTRLPHYLPQLMLNHWWTWHSRQMFSEKYRYCCGDALGGSWGEPRLRIHGHPFLRLILPTLTSRIWLRPWTRGPDFCMPAKTGKNYHHQLTGIWTKSLPQKSHPWPHKSSAIVSMPSSKIWKKNPSKCGPTIQRRQPHYM